MMSKIVLTLMLGLIAVPQQAPAPPTQTPGQCIADVRTYVTKRTAELRPLTSETAMKLTAAHHGLSRPSSWNLLALSLDLLPW